MVANAIETTNLTRRFDERTAVEDLTLAIPPGTVFGFLLALAAARAVSALAPKYLIALGPRDALAMTVAALVFALIAGLVPARYLANLDPATAFTR